MFSVLYNTCGFTTECFIFTGSKFVPAPDHHDHFMERGPDYLVNFTGDRGVDSFLKHCK